MTYKELYNICHDEAVAYANTEQWSKRTGEEKSFLIQGYLDAMMEARKSEITEKKKEYPKTYEECLKILGIKLSDCYIQGYKSPLLEDLQELLICRDAYWKLYGEEMGLGKPWEPDLEDNTTKYTIVYTNNGIERDWELHINHILSFPTEEMRDAFYENFKELIEQCKELL